MISVGFEGRTRSTRANLKQFWTIKFWSTLVVFPRPRTERKPTWSNVFRSNNCHSAPLAICSIIHDPSVVCSSNMLFMRVGDYCHSSDMQPEELHKRELKSILGSPLADWTPSSMLMWVWSEAEDKLRMALRCILNYHQSKETLQSSENHKITNWGPGAGQKRKGRLAILAYPSHCKCECVNTFSVQI